MSYLFEIRDQVVVPQPEVLLIYPFSLIWKRDKEKGKPTALLELAVAEFVSSENATNPFRGYHSDERLYHVRQGLKIPAEWNPDPLVYEAIDYLENLQQKGSFSFRYLRAAQEAAEKLKTFFVEVDLNERHPKFGTPIFKVSDITKALRDTEHVISNLKTLEKRVHEEVVLAERTKGNASVSEFMK